MAHEIKRILVIENDDYWGELITSTLTKKGHEVSWFVRVNRARAGEDAGLMLMSMDGKETRLDPSNYDVVLVDGRMDQFSLHGWEVTPDLVALGMTVVGISGSAGINDEMIGLGAKAGVMKHDLFLGLMKGDLDLKKVLDSAPNAQKA